MIARLFELKRQATELTAREREILDLLGKGHPNRQIADELIIRAGTVKNHVHNILEKLDAHTRKQAAMIARQLPMGEGMAKGGPNSLGPTRWASM